MTQKGVQTLHIVIASPRQTKMSFNIYILFLYIHAALELSNFEACYPTHTSSFCKTLCNLPGEQLQYHSAIWFKLYCEPQWFP